MSGTALADFNDFVEGTGPTYVTGPMSLVNEAVENTYWFGRLLQGKKSKKKMIQGGANIRESIVFKDGGTFETYLPGQNHNWKNLQRLNKVQSEWRYTLAHMAWVEQEIINNEIISYGTEDARFHEYVNIRNEKETLMWSSIWNGLEALLWQVPFPADMEGTGTDATEPYSIPAIINEDTAGLFDPQTSGAFTTIGGIDPTSSAVNGRFTPQQATYDTDTATGEGGIFSSMDDLWEDLTFEQPPTMKQYWEDPRYNKQMIVTTKRGRSIYKRLLRSSQDHFIAGPQDPAYPDPQYYGIPIQRASVLEGLALYDDGSSALADEFGAADKGPRYYCVNAEYLYPVFHVQRYFYKYEVTKHHNVPDTWVMPVAVWYNLMFPSRQRQGILSPSGSVYTS